MPNELIILYSLTANSSNFVGKNRQNPVNFSEALSRIRQMILPIVKKPGVHSPNRLAAAGFYYTGHEDAARCNYCDLEVSNWTLDMDPWSIHSTQKSNCRYVCSMRSHLLPHEIALLCPPPMLVQENPPKRRKTEIIDYENSSDKSVEADLYRKARTSTYSTWRNCSAVPSEDMINAGFTSCNVGDRVICAYCNLTCHQWTPHVDEPREVHKTLSPQCPFVKQMLSNRAQPCIINSNQILDSEHGLSARTTTNSISLSSRLYPFAHRMNNRNISHSGASPSTSSIEESIRVDSADPPIQHDQTCAECQKSLYNMGTCYSTTADIARWLVHCVHTKQFSADQVYDQIQKSKVQQSK